MSILNIQSWFYFHLLKYPFLQESLDDFSLIDSGHILGAKGLLFDDIFYTGDICTRDRGFLKGAKIPRCNEDALSVTEIL